MQYYAVELEDREGGGSGGLGESGGKESIPPPLGLSLTLKGVAPSIIPTLLNLYSASEK
jgi:hypothetical protein